MCIIIKEIVLKFSIIRQKDSYFFGLNNGMLCPCLEAMCKYICDPSR